MSDALITKTNSSSFRAVLSYTQKAHFKSTHMQKLYLALDVYRGLGTIPSTRADTITKVTSMLLHPFPKVRQTGTSIWHTIYTDRRRSASQQQKLFGY